MNRLILRRKYKIDPWDWLLIIGLALAPMTNLRLFWKKIGPAELLCAIWTLRYFNPKRIIFSDIFKFFVMLILCFGIGVLIGMSVTPGETDPLGILVWIYLGYISCMIYIGFYKRDVEYTELVLFTGVVVSTVWYMFLYVYSKTISPSIFGVRLWYGGRRYSGGANNPHQLAVLMCGCIFCYLRNVMQKRHILISLLLAACCMMMELATESSTGLVAILLAGVVGIYVFTAKLSRGWKMKAGIMILETAAIMLICVVFFSRITEYVYNWIASDNNGLGRFSIFSHITDSFEKSPVFGTGTGTHSSDSSGEIIEYHNTYLEVLAAGGIMAVLVLLWFTVRIIKKASGDAYSYPVIAVLYAYGIGGFAMRRLPYWWLLTFVIVISEGWKKEKLAALYAEEYEEDEDDEEDENEGDDETGPDEQ